MGNCLGVRSPKANQFVADPITSRPYAGGYQCEPYQPTQANFNRYNTQTQAEPREYKLNVTFVQQNITLTKRQAPAPPVDVDRLRQSAYTAFQSRSTPNRDVQTALTSYHRTVDPYSTNHKVIQPTSTTFRSGQPSPWSSISLAQPSTTGISKADQRCFGEYRCHGCYRTWSSASSWRNKGQQCKKCNTHVMAHIQRPLDKTHGLDNRIDPNNKHLQHLCQKCKELGRNCRQEKTRRGRNSAGRQSDKTVAVRNNTFYAYDDYDDYLD